MKLAKAISNLLEPWTSSVATAIIAALDRAVPARVVRVLEQGNELLLDFGDGNATAKVATDAIESAPDLTNLLRGTKIEILLDPKHFVFRSVEVPARAADFLEGIVRAQIDKLTPWTAKEALFGCSPPEKNDSETITTTVAITTRTIAEHYIRPLSTFHPVAISIWTRPPDHEIERLKVFDQNARQYLGAARLNWGLKTFFLAAGSIAAIAVLATLFIGSYLGEREEEINSEILQRRASIRANSDAGDRSPISILRRRKLESPTAVFVLDGLTKALPDNTYVTELHLADNKIQIVGISADASSLISLIEESVLFKNATFSAPTTSTASDRGERFHIEAQIQSPKAGKP